MNPCGNFSWPVTEGIRQAHSHPEAEEEGLQLPQGTGGALVVLTLLGGRFCSAASLAQVQGLFSVLLVRQGPGGSPGLKYYSNTWFPPPQHKGKFSNPDETLFTSSENRASALAEFFHSTASSTRTFQLSIFLWFECKENNYALPSSRHLKEYASQMFFGYCMLKSVWPPCKEAVMAVGAQDMQRANSTGTEDTLVRHKDKQKLQCPSEQNQYHAAFFKSPSL